VIKIATLILPLVFLLRLEKLAIAMDIKSYSTPATAAITSMQSFDVDPISWFAELKGPCPY